MTTPPPPLTHGVIHDNYLATKSLGHGHSYSRELAQYFKSQNDDLWEIARKQLQKSRATTQDHTCKVLSAAYTFPRSLANSLAYKLYGGINRALCLSLINNISVKMRDGMQKKAWILFTVRLLLNPKSFCRLLITLN